MNLHSMDKRRNMPINKSSISPHSLQVAPFYGNYRLVFFFICFRCTERNLIQAQEPWGYIKFTVCLNYHMLASSLLYLIYLNLYFLKAFMLKSNVQFFSFLLLPCQWKYWHRAKNRLRDKFLSSSDPAR